MTLQELLDKVEKLDREATSGPWAAYKWGNSVQVDIGPEPVGRRPCICDWSGFDSNDLPLKQNQHNVDFVAESRQLLPLLVKIVKELTTDERFDDHDVLAMIETAECVINEENAI